MVREEYNLSRKLIRKISWRLLEEMKPSDNAEGEHSPINLTGENALNYKHIREFMMLKKKGLLLEKDCVEGYSKATNSEVEIVEANFKDDIVKPGRILDISTKLIGCLGPPTFKTNLAFLSQAKKEQ